MSIMSVTQKDIQKIKIKYHGFNNDFTHFNSFILKYLKEKHIEVNENPDLYVFNTNLDNYKLDKYNSKKLMISGENLFYYNQVYSNDIVKFFYRVFCRLGLDSKKNFDNIFSKKKCYLRPHAINFVSNIVKKKYNNHYAIITNDIKGQNILNYPYFFHVFLDKFQDFIDIKKENRYIPQKKNFVHLL